jgi:hypothetical protein
MSTRSFLVRGVRVAQWAQAAQVGPLEGAAAEHVDGVSQARAETGHLRVADVEASARSWFTAASMYLVLKNTSALRAGTTPLHSRGAVMSSGTSSYFGQELGAADDGRAGSGVRGVQTGEAAPMS